MTTINEKLGLRPAGKRAMMKLPEDRALRNRVTSAKCPACQCIGATLSKVYPGTLWCTRCAHHWELEA